MHSVYDAAGGDDGILRLAEAWHRRVLADEVVGHAFSHGYHPEHTARLAAYWAEALGGPTTYSEQYGDETAVVRMHSGNGEHAEMDRRAIECFDQALTDAGLTAQPLRRVLHDYFAWATNTTMAKFHESADDVPDGLPMPHWSWDGLQPMTLDPLVERLRANGTRFRNDIVTGVGGRQILAEDPSGNPVELFEPTTAEARLESG